jgi:D-aminopeptidase
VIQVQNIILRNFWLKFFSLALATVIWLAIHYDIHKESVLNHLSINHLLAQEYIRVPVTVVTRPGDTRTFKITPNEVVIIAVGEETALRRAAKKEIKASVDLADFNTKQPTLLELRANAPADVNVVEISPSVVTVQQVFP